MKTLVALLTIIIPALVLAAEPTPPTAPTMFTPSFASSALSTVNVTSGDGADLKAKIEAITTCGVEVVIPVASGYAPASNITLPAVAGSCVGSGSGRTAITGSSGAHAVAGSGGLSATAATGGDNFITIRSANSGSLTTYGGTVGPSDQANMPTITVPNGSQLFLCQTGTHHIRIVGLNIVTNSNQAINDFMLCQSSTTGSDIHHIVLDRNYMTADSTKGSIQGLQMGGANIALVGNRITNVFDPTNGNETHGVLFSTGTGPYHVWRNEICAQSINLFIGDNMVNLWTGGSYGVGSPIIPSNGYVHENWMHKICVPVGSYANIKNIQEIKHGSAWEFNGNIYDTTYAETQQLCIQLVSYRASQSKATDIKFNNNWVKNCPQAMGVTFRPTEGLTAASFQGDGTTNCSGGPCVQINLGAGVPCNCTTGDTVEIVNVSTVVPSINGAWRLTRVSDYVVTIPVAFTSTSGVTGSMLKFYQAEPLDRVEVCNNLFMNISSAAQTFGVPYTAFNFNTNPTVNPSGGTDAGISRTGSWKPSNFKFCHNTIVNPTAGDTLKNFITILGPGNNNPYTQWQGDNWAWRDNVVKISDTTQSIYGTMFAYGVGGGTAYGTNALNNLSDPATRDFSHSVGFASSFGDEATKYTGSDSWITASNGTCAAVAVLVDCTATTIAGAALQAGSPGHNAASDGADVGIDATALAAAVANVPQ